MHAMELRGKVLSVCTPFSIPDEVQTSSKSRALLIVPLLGLGFSLPDGLSDGCDDIVSDGMLDGMTN